MKATVARVDVNDLFEKPGSLEMRYSPRVEALSGHVVEIGGVLVPIHTEANLFLLTDATGECPDCSPVPIPAVFLSDLQPVPDEVVPGKSRVRIRGILRFGLQVDASGYASFLRIESGAFLLTQKGGPRSP